MEVIAHIHSAFPQKFGIPRQSGLAKTQAVIEFEPAYALPDAVRGLEGFSHLWLIWEFQEAGSEWTPTVRPPLLGGNKRMGVFATRSPFRPNHLGLSSVELERIEYTEAGPLLHVLGADLRDNTPIFDIKPYLAYTDSHPDARGGFTETTSWTSLEVRIEDVARDAFEALPSELACALLEILELDPRPARQRGAHKDFSLAYGAYNVVFYVEGTTLFVKRIEALN